MLAGSRNWKEKRKEIYLHKAICLFASNSISVPAQILAFNLSARQLQATGPFEVTPPSGRQSTCSSAKKHLVAPGTAKLTHFALLHSPFADSSSAYPGRATPRQISSILPCHR